MRMRGWSSDVWSADLGSSDMGACATSCAVWVEAMKVTYKGKAIMATPSISTRWVTISRIGRRSIMVGSTCWQASADASVIHLAVDVAELHHSEQYADGHKYDRLGGRRNDVQALETGVIYLVTQTGCAGDRAGVGRAAWRGKMGRK